MQRREFLRMATVWSGAAAVPTSWMLGAGRAMAETAPDSSPILFNQLGYLPGAQKIITLRKPSATFTVKAVASGATVEQQIVLQGKADAVRDDAASGDQVQLCDISAVRKPGMYVLETDAGKSAPFEIGNDVYRRA